VHDCRRSRLRERSLNAASELFDLGKLACLARCPLLSPAGHIAREEPVGLAEITEPDRVVVDRMKPREHVDQVVRHAPRVLDVELGQFRNRAHDPAFDLVHHVKGRADDVGVVAERTRAGNGNT
jgi:hypothetical protein